VKKKAFDLEHAVDRAVERQIRLLLTAPLTTKELAAWFRCHRSRVPEILKTIRRKQRIGQRWRVSLFSMPPEYFREIGILPMP
jgi:hypothetical protein